MTENQFFLSFVNILHELRLIEKCNKMCIYSYNIDDNKDDDDEENMK